MSNLCGISAAESNRVSIRYIAEDQACWAVTPNTGVTRELRLTGSSLTARKETQVSEEIRADRMISNVIEVGASSGGEINFEFSAGTYDDFFEAYLGGTWSKPMTFDGFAGAVVSWGATNRIDVAGGNFTSYFVANRYVKTEGFNNPENNKYSQIASVAFVGGVTQVTVTSSNAVIEPGNAFTRVVDANDFILASTAIRAGTGGLNTFDTNGSNGFAAAITAGHLRVGQRIFVSGLGYATGSVTFQSSGVPADGETVTVSDGVRTVVFEFDSNNAFTRGRVPVKIGVDHDATGANFQKAVMEQLAQRKLLVSAVLDTSGPDAIVNLKNLHSATGSIAESAANTVSTNFSGYTASSGIYTITGLTNDVITVAEPVATNANAGALSVVVKGSHLRNPGVLADIKRRSFTIETGYTDVNQYFNFSGQRVGSFSLSVSAGEIITGSFEFEGKGTSLSTATVLGAAPYTVLATTATEVMNATVNVGALRKNGAPLTTAIQSIEITGDSSLRQQDGVSSKFPIGIGLGSLLISGSLMAYFETLDLYNDFLNHTTISLSWDFKDNFDNFYTFTIPALKLTSDDVMPEGINQDIMEEIEWTAQRDPILNTQMMIDRFSSILPTTN